MFDLDHIFKYHPPNQEQLTKYNVLRQQARNFAELIVAIVPEGADQSDALRKLRECVMAANAAIALNGRLETYGGIMGLAAQEQESPNKQAFARETERPRK